MLLLTTWEAAYRLTAFDRKTNPNGWKDWVFPAPSTMWRALNELLTYSPAFGGRLLVQAIGVSLSRLVVGFLTSIALGGLLGVLMWRIRSLDEFLGPLFLGLQTLPSVCWVPLALLWFGQTEVQFPFLRFFTKY